MTTPQAYLAPPVPPSASAWRKAWLLMVKMPSTIKAMGAAMRLSGKAPAELRAINGTSTGTRPTISEVTGTPTHCTAVAATAK